MKFLDILPAIIAISVSITGMIFSILSLISRYNP